MHMQTLTQGQTLTLHLQNQTKCEHASRILHTYKDRGSRMGGKGEGEKELASVFRMGEWTGITVLKM